MIQLASNPHAAADLDAGQTARLGGLVGDPETYGQHRARLPWI